MTHDIFHNFSWNLQPLRSRPKLIRLMGKFDVKCGKLIRGQSVVLRLDQKHHIRLAEGSIHRSFLLPDLGARPLAGYDYGGHMTLSELVRQYYVRGLLRCPLKRALLKLWGYCISFHLRFRASYCARTRSYGARPAADIAPLSRVIIIGVKATATTILLSYTVIPLTNMGLYAIYAALE